MGFGTANGVRNARFLFLLGVTGYQTDGPSCDARPSADVCVSQGQSVQHARREAAMKESDLSW